MTFATVDPRAFDEAVVRAFGADIVTYTVDGTERRAFAVAVPGVQTPHAYLNGKVPVFWSAPDDPYQNHLLPSFVVRRTEVRPAYDRAPWYHTQQQQVGASVVAGGQWGPARREVKLGARPYDFPYDVQIFARLRNDANFMLHHFSCACLAPWFPLSVVDSVGDTRLYDTGDFNISDVSELADISNRSIGYTISFTVRGEWDLTVSSEVATMQAFDLTMFNYAEGDTP
jgi:hypothetical protein